MQQGVSDTANDRTRINSAGTPMNSRKPSATLRFTLWSLTGLLAALIAVPSDWDWPTATPESQRLSASRLDSFWADLQARGTTALLIIRNDKNVFERYARDYSRSRQHYAASM